MTSTRTKAACLRSIEVDGLHTFKPTTPLQRLVRAALEAERNLTGEDYYRLDDDEIDRREDACLTTRVALRKYLASQGLTFDEINGIGEVL